MLAHLLTLRVALALCCCAGELVEFKPVMRHDGGGVTWHSGGNVSTNVGAGEVGDAFVEFHG